MEWHLPSLVGYPLRSTVMLRFRKSISEHYFLTIWKWSNNDFQCHRGVIYRIQQYSLTKNVFLSPHVRNFTLIYGAFSCLIIVHFGLIFMENFVIFSNARSILELMRCNWNLKRLDILTLLSFDCKTWALRLSEHLKKLQNMFLSSFCQLQLSHHFFCTFSWT